METKQYKNLGNSIRESVFRAKEAPTMLPDETIEKLGLGEDDVLSMEEEQLDEATSLAAVHEKIQENSKELKKARAVVQRAQKVVEKLEAKQEKLYVRMRKIESHQIR